MRGRLVPLAVACAAALALLVAPGSASAAFLHPEASYEFGKAGTEGSQFEGLNNVAFNQASNRLLVLAGGEQKIQALNYTAPHTLSPVGGAFPLSATTRGGDADFAVDNSAGSTAGRIYFAPDYNPIEAWGPAGNGLPALTPNPVGEPCGVGVDGSGRVWVGNYGKGTVERFTPTGTANLEISTPGTVCHIAVDPTNDDLYVAYYSGGTIAKYTAATGYSPSSQQVIAENICCSDRLALNASRGVIYVAHGEKVSAYDTDTGTLIEEFGEGCDSGVAVDEATDTVFVADACSGKVEEWPGVIVPEVETGPPVGNTEVSASVGLSGGGPVTECLFEYGESAGSYGSQVPCDPPTPYNADQPQVTAELTGVTAEHTYHYRVIAKNANGTIRGADRTILPHFVDSLKTAAATDITRTTASLNAEYIGNGEDTHYYFDWGTGTGYGNQTTPPPGEDGGTSTGPAVRSSTIAGLTAGTTYHFRVTASNSHGTSVAFDESFTTAPAVTALTTQPASDVEPASARLNASLDPDGLATTYYFEWGKDSKYTQATPLPPGDPVGTTAPGVTQVSTKLEGLERGTTYHYRVVAVNETGTSFGLDSTFTTPQSPSISSFASRNVAGDSAELIATVNPNGFATTYWFEYGPTPSFGQEAPVPPGTLPAVEATEEVAIPIDGLQEVTYYFRLVAENEWGQTSTETQTFDFRAPTSCPNHTVRQQTGAAYLPDCRAYEIASAARAAGTALFPAAPFSATANGRLAFYGLLNIIPGSGEPINGDLLKGDLYVASRTSSGWTTRYVGIPGNQSLGQSGAPGEEYGGDWRAVLHDSTMSKFLVWDRAQESFLLGGPLHGTYSPDVIDNQGQILSRLPSNVEEIPGALQDMTEGGFKGSVAVNPSMSHYVFSSIKTAFAAEGVTDPPGSAYDDEVGSGRITIVSLDEEEENIPRDPLAGVNEEFIRIPAVSDDGSHILMSTAAPGGNVHLYMRVDHERSYDISVDESGVNQGVRFAGMPADGSRVYFTTSKQMTADDTDSSVDLYMWSEATNSLTRISDSGNLPGNSDDCETSWISGCDVEVVPVESENRLSDSPLARESGDIYFYSPELLDGARGFPGKRNLYVYRGGSVQHVATLEPNSPATRINVNPDGTRMAMITATRLTAYDNAGKREMYVYDAAARTLKCVSCIPSGDAPTSNVEGSQNGLFMTYDGRAFFSTQDSLVPQDANGIIDVYEFVGGRPQLISSGTGDNQGNSFQPIGLVGVTGDGIDAYLSTYETLVPQDENGEVLKIYDARSNGGFVFDSPPQPCEAADECHGAESASPPAPQIGTAEHLGDGGNLAVKKAKKKSCKKSKKSCKKSKKKKGKVTPMSLPARVRLSVALPIALLAAGLALLAGGAQHASAKSEIFSYTSRPTTTQAGGHPDIFTTFELGSRASSTPAPCYCNDPKDITLHVPAGVVANPHVVDTCSVADIALFACPADTQAGLVVIKLFGYGVLPLYRLQPQAGQAALFGFALPFGLSIPQYVAFNARTGSDYGLDVRTIGISHTVPLLFYAPIFWGVPGAGSNDYMRFAPGENEVFCEANPTQFLFERNEEAVKLACPGGTNKKVVSSLPIEPFNQNPTRCTGPLSSSIEVLAYDREESRAESSWPATTGCDQLSFDPSLAASPTTTQTDTAAGLEVDLRAPQFQDPSTPSPSELRASRVTLPEGFSINPNAGDGKTTCSDLQSRVGTELEAECPETSKVGTVELDSSALPAPIGGFIYLGEQKPGDPYRLILTANGFGTAVKLVADVHADPVTGRLVTTLEELPQSPFQRFTLHFFGSERGLLATPEQCGTFPVESTFTPWDSFISDQTATQFFSLDSGPGGKPCPNGPRPFGPAFQAGSDDNTGGAHSTFTLRINREDGDQNLAGLDVTAPPGFVATLKGVPYCPESTLAHIADPSYSGRAEIASPACPAASLIGSSKAAAGAGSKPVNVDGKVYLAGPYKGQPLSLAVVVPAVSGPYDLGNVVVRAGIHVDPETARVSAISDPIPQILEGVPLRTRLIQVTLDRPDFALNPTNCDQFAVDATVSGDETATATRSTPYQVANCTDLAFKPKLSMKLTGGLKQRGHPAIHAVLTAKPGEANIHSVSVTLPKGELLDNNHIKTICTRVQFAAEKCPEGSLLGSAEAETPLLDNPLRGNAFLRSSNHRLPDLVLDLRGQLDIVLAGRIDSVNGRLRVTFESVPDAAISRVALDLAGGGRGLLQNSNTLCGAGKKASVAMTGQNGATTDAQVKLQVACGSSKAKRRGRR